MLGGAGMWLRLQAIAADLAAGYRSAVSCAMGKVDNAQPTGGSRVTQGCQGRWRDCEV
jgi:hypothetical protein